MNIQDLKYYHELVNLKSYTKTAQVFNVSQPTITAAIKRLENNFNAKFLIRDQSHKSIIVTKLGLQFNAHVEAILNELELVKEEINQENGSSISFGLPPIIGRNYFPKLVPQLLKKDILTHLEVIEKGSSDLLRMLNKGEINFALLGLTNIDLNHNIEFKLLKKYTMNIIVGSNHPLAVKDNIYFKEIAPYPFIGLNNDYIHTQTIKNLTLKNKINLNIIYHSPDVRVVKSLVSQNLGVSYLTALAINKADKLKAIHLLDENQPSFNLVAATRKNYLMTDLENKFWNILTQESSL